MTEYEIHTAVAGWLNTLDILWWHTPNEGKRGRAEAMRLRKMGLRRGIPDIIAIRPDGVCIAAEIKRPGERLTKEQADILTHLNSKGWYTDVVYGVECMMRLYNKRTPLTHQAMLYLASPYTSRSAIETARKVRAAKETAYRLCQHNVLVYAPVVYGHTIELGESRKQTHDYWMRHCKAMLAGCRALVVCDHIDGWESSKGVALESTWAREQGMPVLKYTEMQ